MSSIGLDLQNPLKMPLAQLGALIDRYQAVRLHDVLPLVGKARAQVSDRHLRRVAATAIDAVGCTRMPVGDHVAIVRSRHKISEQTLIHGLQWSMLDAALLTDGYTVSHGNDAYCAIRSWLLQQPQPEDTERMLAALARRRAAELEVEGPELPYSAAWKGPTSAPMDLRLVVVLSPRQSQRKQLEALPLRLAGQPRIPVILRPADDGTMAHHKTGALTYTGPQYRALMRSFREHRNPGAFPYWETADVLNYRPDLWARLDRTSPHKARPARERGPVSLST